MGDEIKFIVQNLSRPPFSMRLSMVTLDAKQGPELLQVVNDVFAYLDSKQQRRDIRDEDASLMGARMLEFVVALGYKSAQEIEAFSEPFLRADKSTIYPLLAWILARLPDLKKRAYLSRFLRPAAIPEEYFADEQIVSLVQRLKALQDEFKELHKSAETARKTHNPPLELERDIRQLDSETEQLDSKIARLRRRVETSPEFAGVDFAQILHATHVLRKEQEEEAALARQLREQRQRLERAAYTRRQAVAKLKDLEEGELSRAPPTAVLQRQRVETAQLRARSEALDREVRERDKALREVARALTSAPLAPEMVERLEDECGMLQQHVESLARQRDASMAGASEQIQLARSHLGAAESRREKLAERVEELEEEQGEFGKELARLAQELKAMAADGKKIMTESELSQMSEEIKGRMNEYKEIKAQLRAAQMENQVLHNTEALLRSRDAKVEEITAELERERGVEGYSATQANLESVSAAQADLNLAKGATLEQISRMVDTITANIKAKRSKLQPLIRDLKAVRQDYDEVEADFTKRQKQHDTVAGQLHADRAALEDEVGKYQTEIAADEQAIQQLRAMLAVTNARAEQARQEAGFAHKGRLSTAFRTYKEMIEKAIDTEQRAQKRLQDEQRDAVATHHDDVGQRKLFTQLRMLLDAKLSSAKKQAEAGSKAAAAGV
jgi:intraflagellar transport protein 81